MSAAYIGAIEHHCPDVTLVLDHFHIVKRNEFGKLFHSDDLEFVMEQAQKKQKGAKDVVTHYSYRIITKSGEVKWVDQYSKGCTPHIT